MFTVLIVEGRCSDADILFLSEQDASFPQRVPTPSLKQLFAQEESLDFRGDFVQVQWPSVSFAAHDELPSSRDVILERSEARGQWNSEPARYDFEWEHGDRGIIVGAETKEEYSFQVIFVQPPAKPLLEDPRPRLSRDRILWLELLD
jgi:hypothetical protein